MAKSKTIALPRGKLKKIQMQTQCKCILGLKLLICGPQECWLKELYHSKRPSQHLDINCKCGKTHMV